ncbi:MAG: two pore domain potassium channel family protein [Verrucomicrobiaceae bacterium]|nr:MAG: two pore domain potassium channel family protein [Verrucomicrobiaceae bacterium]
MSGILPASLDIFAADALRLAAGLAGVLAILYFFKSIIRVGVLNQRYQDPLAFWVGRVLLNLFRFRISRLPKNDPHRHEIMVWYWPCSLIGIITAWFLLVTFGFALLNWALRADATFTSAVVSSGSALSTLGFSTPTSLSGQILAIIEGAIGLFLIVYLFTFLPGFMQLIHERGSRVAWVYARTGPNPSGAEVLRWFYRNGRAGEIASLCDDWEIFFRDLGQSRSFLPILCVVRPLNPSESWVCAFGAFLDALALLNTTVDRPTESSRICFELGVTAVQNIHEAMRGTPISPERSPTLMHVRRQDYDTACGMLSKEGVALKADREAAWKDFIGAHMLYEQEIAWLAASLGDPTPFWTRSI